ncbi:N-acetylmuramoyl-L-alanine amidase [Patescibacteria group bacterium]
MINKTTSWEYKESPNKRIGRKKPCTVLVMHYTAGGNTNQIIKYFQQPDGVSAHFVVGRDGRVVQMVKLEDVAWHAGNSVWKGEKWVNYFSVGIEISNWGPLKKKGETYYCWPNNYNTILNKEVFEDDSGNFWEAYPSKQINAVIELCKSILEIIPEITLENVVGHEHISPGRKTDPGPAFPWDKVKKGLTKEVQKEEFVTKPQTSPHESLEKDNVVTENVIEEKDLSDKDFTEQVKARSGNRKGGGVFLELISRIVQIISKGLNKQK